MIFWLLDHALQLQSVVYRRLMGSKATKLGSPTNLRSSLAGFAYCSVVVCQANVLPHPPLRSRPTSAGATRTRPVSAGRERIPGPPVARGNYHHH